MDLFSYRFSVHLYNYRVNVICRQMLEVSLDRGLQPCHVKHAEAEHDFKRIRSNTMLSVKDSVHKINRR